MTFGPARRSLTSGPKGLNEHTKSAIAVHDSWTALWYALVFCGVSPPYPEGGPEDWKKKDDKQELLQQRIQVLESASDICDHWWKPYYKVFRKATDRCINLNMPLVRQTAKKFLHAGEQKKLEPDDLLQEGVFGLVRAIQKFEPEKGFAFSTYAFYWIYQSIGRAIAVAGLIHTPIDSSRKVRENLKEKVAVAKRVGSLNVCINEGTATGCIPLELGDLTEQDTVLSPEEFTCILQDRRNLMAAMQTQLTPKESMVLRMRFENEETLEEVGIRLGVTRERVRQLEAGAIKKLKDWMDPDEANLRDSEKI